MRLGGLCGEGVEDHVGADEEGVALLDGVVGVVLDLEVRALLAAQVLDEELGALLAEVVDVLHDVLRQLAPERAVLARDEEGEEVLLDLLLLLDEALVRDDLAVHPRDGPVRDGQH